MQLVPKNFGRDLVKETGRPIDGDPLSELNPLDVKFFRYGSVKILIPITDPVNTRRCLLFLSDEIPHLIAEMDRVKDRRSKSLLALSRIQAWSAAFQRGLKGYGKV